MKALSLLIRYLWPRLKFFKSRSNVKVKVTRSKIMVPNKSSCHKHMCKIKAPSLLKRKLWPRLNILKVGQISRSRSWGQQLWYHVKGLVTSNTHVQYESFISSSYKVMAKIKVFVHASHADADADANADARAMTLAPRTYVLPCLKLREIE